MNPSTRHRRTLGVLLALPLAVAALTTAPVAQAAPAGARDAIREYPCNSSIPSGSFALQGPNGKKRCFAGQGLLNDIGDTGFDRWNYFGSGTGTLFFDHDGRNFAVPFSGHIDRNHGTLPLQAHRYGLRLN